MKWYLALSESSFGDQQYFDLLRVALASARRNTTLRPHFLYDGSENEFTKVMQAQGVTIVPCESRFKSLIEATWADKSQIQRIALGAFLRLEIPKVEKEDEFILYTDCDVLFLSDPKLSSFRPGFFSVAPEFDIGDYNEMNTGVIVMNVPAMKKAEPEFSKFVQENFATFTTFDQTALRVFFKGRYDFLPPTLNWKPYWGPAHSAEIVHFHLKPYHIKVFAEGNENAEMLPLKNLYDRSPEFARKVADSWYAMLDVAREEYPTRADPLTKSFRPETWPADFDGNEYLRMYPDVAGAKVDPYLHFLTAGEAEGRLRPKRKRSGARRSA